MTRSEKNELLVKFACAALNGMLSSAPIVDRTAIFRPKWAEAAFMFGDAMLEEYIKRQPAAPVAPVKIPPPSDAERAEVASMLEAFKAQMAADDAPEPRVCPEMARNVGTPPA